jgi:hypothetical protein
LRSSRNICAFLSRIFDGIWLCFCFCFFWHTEELILLF